MYRTWRLGKEIDFPPFYEKVLVKKRTWKKQPFEKALEGVRYISPAPDEHGHWISKEGEPIRVTKQVMKKLHEPITKEKWMAVEKDVADHYTQRRRYLEKGLARMAGYEGPEEEEEEIERRRRVCDLIEEEMRYMAYDEMETVADELVMLAQLRKIAEEPTIGRGDPADQDSVPKRRCLSMAAVASSSQERSGVPAL